MYIHTEAIRRSQILRFLDFLLATYEQVGAWTSKILLVHKWGHGAVYCI